LPFSLTLCKGQAGIGEIGERFQLNEKEQYGAVQDLGLTELENII
jgi:hypothetical protein